VTVVLVEQNVFLALQVAHRGYVLEVGKIILEGDIEQFKDSELVKRAYLGE
jgi:branched-chain amino acid transport system ATP-binding protein